MKLRPLYTLSAVLILGGVSATRAFDVLDTSAFIDLPKQPLAKSVINLSEQANVDIGCTPKDCEGILAPRVFGTQTVRRALETLLHGLPLHYKAVADLTIAILPTTDEEAGVEPPSGPRDVPLAQMLKPSGLEISQDVVHISTYLPGVAELGPVVVYSRRQILESGATSLEDFLSRVPQNLNSNSKATAMIGIPQNGERGSSYNLWGLGERGTLVLINKHRVAESAMGNFVDLSLIPLAAVDHVEVLSEGAAALYGADAVAGVVNIALRDDFRGIETDISNAWPTHSGANQFSAAQTLGKKWSTGNVVTSFTYRRDQRLLSTDRPYSDMPGYTLLPALRDYDGYVHLGQDLASTLRVDIDGLYSNRHTDDDANYTWNGVPVGPYAQRGVANQYFLAPVLNWTLGAAWHGIADFDLSQNRFTETTAYGAEAPSGAAIYSTLSEARVRTMDGRVDGPIYQLPAGKVKLALGLGERWEDYHSYGSSSEASNAGSLRRHVAAAYTELDLPLFCPIDQVLGFHRLDLRLAVRGERYPGLGSTVNPKFDFGWQPIEYLNVRGSYGTSFAIAGYSQTILAYNAVAIERTTSAACASESCLVAEEFGARPTYRPERSKSYTLGLDWTSDDPVSLRARADFYSVSYLDQVAAPPDVNTLLSHPAAFAGLVVQNPTEPFLSDVFARAATYPQGLLNLAGSYTPGEIEYYVDERTRNFAQTRAVGIDFNVDYDLQSSYGVWTLGFSGTRVLRLDNRASPVAREVSAADTFAHPLSHRYQARVGLQAESAISAQLRINYLGGYTNTQVSPSEGIASWTTVDATLIVPMKTIHCDLGKKSRFQLSLDNLMNRAPPYVQTVSVPDGYDPVLANALGRIVKLRFVLLL